MDIWKHNQKAWDKLADENIEWSVPVSNEIIEKARNDDWEIILTPIKPVPRDWFGDVKGKDILCLASGGGQQVPILAAAGANVTSFDDSAKQLEKDRFVAERENLEIKIEQGDAADLSRFADQSFDLIFQSLFNLFYGGTATDLERMFQSFARRRQASFRVLINPFIYMFDQFAEE